MSVVKLKAEKQKKLKVLSKAMYIVSRVIQICLKIACGFVAIAAILVPIVFSNFDIKNDEIKIFGETVKYELTEDSIILGNDSDSEKITSHDIDKVKVLIDKFQDNKSVILVAIELTICFGVASIILLIIVFTNLEKLFRNIHNEKTPFTLDNVKYMKAVANFTIAMIIVSYVGNLIAAILLHQTYGVSVDGANIIFILFLFIMAHIFEYGCEIQKDSKGVIYDEK